MTLASARFNSDDTLNKIAQPFGGSLQKGATGKAVHLVQMALLDFGIPLPRSTGNPKYSPDGIYGDETEQAVRAFQKTRPLLVVDGKVGEKTLKELDARFANFSHVIKLHFRSIALTSVPFQRSFSNAQIVYGQYGIDVKFGSGESVNLPADKREFFDRIDQECNWDLTDGEFNELLGIGSPAPKNDVLVFHVHSFADANVLGCGGHAKTRTACTVTANAFAWDTAHEVGHALLTSAFSPVHVDDTRNLMFPVSRRSAVVPVLTDRQVARIRASVCCRAV
jgi:peptidoglycan hydrolase-like protein with peptidoglycan-binding domain